MHIKKIFIKGALYTVYTTYSIDNEHPYILLQFKGYDDIGDPMFVPLNKASKNLFIVHDEGKWKGCVGFRYTTDIIPIQV